MAKKKAVKKGAAKAPKKPVKAGAKAAAPKGKKAPAKKVPAKKAAGKGKSAAQKLRLASPLPHAPKAAALAGKAPKGAPSARAFVVPVSRGLLSKEPRTLSENYDEFQHDHEVTAIIQANPHSILRVDMAHCNPGSGLEDGDGPETIDFAKKQLAEMRGLFTELRDFFYVYKITVKGRPGAEQIGLGAHVATAAIHDPQTNPGGKIIRNEAIFVHKAEGRARLIQGLGAVIGTVNLCAPDPDRALQKALQKLSSGRPCDIGGVDRKGDRHEVWVVREKTDLDALTALYAGRELFVADGNHRSKASQLIGLSHFLAVIFCGETMNIDPYHRLVADIPFPPAVFVAELQKRGFKVTPLAQKTPFAATEPHRVGLYIGGSWYLLEPQNLSGLDARSRIDAQLIEDRILRDLLGRDPGDKRIAYVGGDYNPAYLQKKVDDGTYQAAFSMPAMTMKEFYAINEARQLLPRKTTWFTPKIRSGLVIGLLD
ncbi:MAG: DUF1015 domain-containing protein [Spirochaetes bacterium]|nr:DUF1015 domain-containing protein [Spirochaetota bacterium]